MKSWWMKPNQFNLLKSLKSMNFQRLPLNHRLPTKKLFQVSSAMFPEITKRLLKSYILLCSFFQSWIGKLGSRADKINSDRFCKENHVKTMCMSFFCMVWSINMFQGKCSKDQILANEVWLGSVGVCHSQRLEVLVNEAVHKMCSTHYPVLCDHRILKIFTSNFTQQPHIWSE